MVAFYRKMLNVLSALFQGTKLDDILVTDSESESYELQITNWEFLELASTSEATSSSLSFNETIVSIVTVRDGHPVPTEILQVMETSLLTGGSVSLLETSGPQNVLPYPEILWMFSDFLFKGGLLQQQ